MSRRDPRPPSGTAPILLAGGETDGELAAVRVQLDALGWPYESVIVGPESRPRLHWNLATDRLLVDGRESHPWALFFRYDAATAMGGDGFGALAWYTTLLGWVLAHPQVAILNRDSVRAAPNKLHILWLARECGLDIPATVATNDLSRLRDEPRGSLIAKPAAGGALCEALETVLPLTLRGPNGEAPAPAIVQERLVPPEVRVYVVGGGCYGFRVESDALDYRRDASVRLSLVPDLPQSLTVPLLRLMSLLRMDFGAADFKARADGTLCFLEINNAPMFAAFDRVANGVLSEAIVAHLGSVATLSRGPTDSG